MKFQHQEQLNNHSAESSLLNTEQNWEQDPDLERPLAACPPPQLLQGSSHQCERRCPTCPCYPWPRTRPDRNRDAAGPAEWATVFFSAVCCNRRCHRWGRCPVDCGRPRSRCFSPASRCCSCRGLSGIGRRSPEVWDRPDPRRSRLSRSTICNKKN